jgi:hypothetical protein
VGIGLQPFHCALISFSLWKENLTLYLQTNVIVLRHHSTVTDPSIHGRGCIPEGGVRTCQHRPKGPHCGLLVVGASGHTLGLCLFVIDGDKATL